MPPRKKTSSGVEPSDLEILSDIAASLHASTDLSPNGSSLPLPSSPRKTTTRTSTSTRRQASSSRNAHASTSHEPFGSGPFSSLVSVSTQAAHAGSRSGALGGLGGVGVGAGVGIDSTMAPHYYEETTPLLNNNVSLPSESSYATGDYNFFGTTGGAFGSGGLGLGASTEAENARASGSGSGSGMDIDGEVERLEEPLDSQSRMRALMKLDADADAALEASNKYQHEVLAVMNKLARATTRTEELQTLVKDMHADLATGTDFKVSAPGTVHVSLPWFKHFHGRDLPSNPEGEGRDRYLATIRHVPWTPTERVALKREIFAHNSRQIAEQATINGEDIEAKLASYDESHFFESTELLDWAKIALVIARRSPIECKIQWMQNDHPLINKVKWSTDETQRMLKIAEEKGHRDWAGIATELGTKRTPAECLRQYRRRAGQRKDWSAEEDNLLREGVRKFGQNWQAVALLVGRHSNQCINRWTKTLRPSIKRGKWTAEEDDLLRAAHAACGPSWKLVEARVKGRTDAQCRERWVNIINPEILPPKIWSEEDEEILVREREVEKKSWSEVAHVFGGKRTDNHCARHYQEIVRNRERVAAGKPIKILNVVKVPKVPKAPKVLKDPKAPKAPRKPPTKRRKTDDGDEEDSAAIDPLLPVEEEGDERESRPEPVKKKAGRPRKVAPMKEVAPDAGGEASGSGEVRRSGRKRTVRVAELDAEASEEEEEVAGTET